MKEKTIHKQKSQKKCSFSFSNSFFFHFVLLLVLCFLPFVKHCDKTQGILEETVIELKIHFFFFKTIKKCTRGIFESHVLKDG